jgi:hypothetical protein
MSSIGTTNPSFQEPHTSEAIFQQLLPAIPGLSKEQLRIINEALAMLDENKNDLEQFLGGTTQQFPEYQADPPSPTNGMTWINTTTNQAKIRMAGATRVFTVV